MSYLQRRPRGTFDAIVIGSGIGGLVTAAALAKLGGQRVLMLERHYRLGGFTHAFTRPGFEWDVGVHYVGSVGPGGALRGLFETLSEGALRWAPLPDVYDRVEIAGRAYDFVTGPARFVAELSRAFPGEADALRAYVRLVVSTARRAQLNLMARLSPPRAPKLTALAVQRHTVDVAERPTLEVLRGLTRNEELIAVLTAQYGNYGLPPSASSFGMHAAAAEHYLEGAWYPEGGSRRFADTLVPVIEARGGHVASSAEVTRILVEGGAAVGVELRNGDTWRAPRIISDAGVRTTFGSLLPPEQVPGELRTLLASVEPSAPHLCLYVGFSKTDAELGLTGTNLWLYDDGAHDDNVWRFAADPSSAFPLLYLSFASAKDPDYQRRFPGKATMEVITMARWEWFARWAGTHWLKRGLEYDAFKESLRARLLEAVYRRLPQVKGHVAHAELSTPLSTAHFTGHPTGEIYGLDSSPARLRHPVRAQTAIPGLVLTGADVASPGVGGAAFGGVLAAAAVLGPQALDALFKRDARSEAIR